MSMMRCDRCDRVVDTDYDLEGTWSDTTYTCTRCTEREEASSLASIIDRFGDLLGEPRMERLQPVEGYTMQLSRTTLAEAERVIRENPELENPERDMGVTLEELE